MPKIIDPETSARDAVFRLWMKAPNPMVTFFKTPDVTYSVRYELPALFQLQHTQMDGDQAGRLLENLQKRRNTLQTC